MFETLDFIAIKIYDNLMDLISREQPVPISTLKGRDIEEPLTVLRGYSAEIFEQLQQKSRQPHITQFCPKDAVERFTSTETFESWRQKDGGRTIYFLTDTTGNLAGTVWYGPSLMLPAHTDSDPNYTFAIRIYEGFQGKGLAKPFVIVTLQNYISLLAESDQLRVFKGIHLSTDVNNPASIPLYRSLGFTPIPSPQQQRVIMVLSPNNISKLVHTLDS